MKSICAAILSFSAILGVFLPGFCPAAQETQTVEKVLLKQGTLFMVKAGLSLEMTNDVKLPREIKVMTNGTFKVHEGKERRLTEGQVLGADGMLTSPDGTLRPVFDHLAFVKGQALMVKDGDAAPLAKDTDLSDGGRVTVDGYLIAKSGERRKLLDGESLELTGNSIPVTDTITLKDGKVIVQKDGSSFEVPPGRSLMMNDGTKVFGDGKVLMKDATTKNLSPGEILKVEGVVPKNP